MPNGIKKIKVKNQHIGTSGITKTLKKAEPITGEDMRKDRPVKPLIIVLSYPPSVNTIWKRGKYGTYLSDEGKAYKEEAIIALTLKRNMIAWPTLSTKTVVQYVPYHPNNRKHDCDNLFKLIGDCIQYAGIVSNDSFLLPRCMNYWVDQQNPRIELVIYPHYE